MTIYHVEKRIERNELNCLSWKIDVQYFVNTFIQVFKIHFFRNKKKKLPAKPQPKSNQLRDTSFKNTEYCRTGYVNVAGHKKCFSCQKYQPSTHWSSECEKKVSVLQTTSNHDARYVYFAHLKMYKLQLGLTLTHSHTHPLTSPMPSSIRRAKSQYGPSWAAGAVSMVRTAVPSTPRPRKRLPP